MLYSASRNAQQSYKFVHYFVSDIAWKNFIFSVLAVVQYLLLTFQTMFIKSYVIVFAKKGFLKSGYFLAVLFVIDFSDFSNSVFKELL